MHTQTLVYNLCHGYTNTYLQSAKFVLDHQIVRCIHSLPIIYLILSFIAGYYNQFLVCPSLLHI